MKRRSPLRDPYGGKDGGDPVVVNSRRLVRWSKKYDSPEDAARRCEHGSYVGHNRSLAYLCILCPESSLD